MKKLTKILALLLSCITVLNVGVFAADNPAETETTVAVTEVTTTLPEESTTAVDEVTTEVQEESTTAADEATTEVQEESTTAADEATTEVQEESTTAADEATTEVQEESTTAVEEETTTEIQQETTTTPDDITTTTPEVIEPDITDPTEPEKPEIVLPDAPKELNGSIWCDAQLTFNWTEVEGADGYALYQKKGDEWVQIADCETTSYGSGGFIYNSKYTFAVKSYIEVDGVKYYSEIQAECTAQTDSSIPQVLPKVESTKDGMKVYWNTIDGVSGYRVYIYKNKKWTKLESVAVNGHEEMSYTYKDVKAGETYRFAIKPYAKGTEGTIFGMLRDVSGTHKDFTKVVITSKSAASSSITLKWDKIDGAASYRVYIYKNGKWSYYKGITKTSYKITGLEGSTKYKIKIKACFKNDGKVTWGTYSDTVTVTTKSQTVKSFRVGKLKKYFTDGDWSVKLTGLKDGNYGTLDYTLAVKGNKIFVRYDYKNNKNIRDFEYLIDLSTETVNLIFDDNKTYVVLKGEEAELATYSAVMMAMVLDMSTAKGVTAKTTVYSGKTAVAEIYQDKDLDAKKTFYFINDKIKALKVTYSDGSSETMKISRINDTPTSSVFKLPKGYKRAMY